MIAAPWYLLSGGIVLLLIGLVLAKAGAGDHTAIDPRMPDDEIAERLKRRKGNPAASALTLVGGLCVLAGLAWRLLRVLFVLS